MDWENGFTKGLEMFALQGPPTTMYNNRHYKDTSATFQPLKMMDEHDIS